MNATLEVKAGETIDVEGRNCRQKVGSVRAQAERYGMDPEAEITRVRATGEAIHFLVSQAHCIDGTTPKATTHRARVGDLIRIDGATYQIEAERFNGDNCRLVRVPSEELTAPRPRADGRTYRTTLYKPMQYHPYWDAIADTFATEAEAMAKAQEWMRKYPKNISKGIMSVKVDSYTAIVNFREVGRRTHFDSKSKRQGKAS